MNTLVYLCIFLSVVKISNQLLQDAVDKAENVTDGIVFTRKCYKDLGCFYNGPPFFDPPRRPISLQPYSPKEMHTIFLLYTPDQKDQAYILKPRKNSITSSPFIKSIPTKIYVYGYAVERGTPGDFSTKIKDALFEIGDYNLIVVDWSKANINPYPQAVANSRMLGAQIAQLTKLLHDTLGVSYESFHIIGHSLGAQAAGYAGKRIPNCGRISGLDPAGPYFTETAKVVHLGETDANFVDVIHTNMAPDVGGVAVTGFGTTDVVGDIDFYVNGGVYQPACGPTAVLTVEGQGCSHNFAQVYYTESIRSNNCTFIATECQSYDDYEKGLCKGNLQAIMGFPASKIPGLQPGHRFYVDTSLVPPYCMKEN